MQTFPESIPDQAISEHTVIEAHQRRARGGRPLSTAEGDKIDLVHIRLDRQTRELLTSLGDGNLSAGVRRAALLVDVAKQEHVNALLTDIVERAQKLLQMRR